MVYLPNIHWSTCQSERAARGAWCIHPTFINLHVNQKEQLGGRGVFTQHLLVYMSIRAARGAWCIYLTLISLHINQREQLGGRGEFNQHLLVYMSIRESS